MHVLVGGTPAVAELSTARVAIAAIDAVVAHVMLVAELDRLIARHILIRQIRRTRREQNTGQRDARQKYAGKDTDISR